MRYAFYVGGAVLTAAMRWTVLRTREYPPEQLQRFDDAGPRGRRRSRAGIQCAIGGGVASGSPLPG